MLLNLMQAALLEVSHPFLDRRISARAGGQKIEKKQSS
ncbi:hypothetical protein J0S82_007326 [Galemys pyrenaicus]|uniref:Uncharacterized protein n=1 Tax=Galemys pyrenaicus TaxID=202257 RepID=A0A8J6A5R4_GALPY|nr:hypothetical protein J0S82_007326 [Galemys pyrenaicus]